MSGIMYIIGTPIGNLEDITLRQLRILGEVDFICAEDTRVTAKLLNYYEIKNQLVSFHEHSTKAEAVRIIERLQNGENCGVVTDAGMPCISDPGEVLVKMACENGVEVKAVPSATAVTTAVALSGMSVKRFVFEGFLPVSRKERTERLELARSEKAVTVFYEAPHKLRNTLADFLEYFGGDRKIALCREITKIHEEVLRFTVSEAVSYYQEHEPRGEYVLVLEENVSDNGSISIEQAFEQVKKLIEVGEKPVDACKAVAKETGYRKGELYSMLCSEK